MMKIEERQLHLPMSWPFSYNKEDLIVTDCNKFSFEWLEKWPFKIRDNFVCLIGDKGSGKTHLANIWAKRVNAEMINASSGMFDAWISMQEERTSGKFLVIDDIDQIENEMLLFYIYNTVKELNAFLLITSKTHPSKWNVSLPDVKSRLSTINILYIRRPNEEAISGIISKLFQQRGVIIQDRTIEFLTNNIERSYESILYWVEKINKFISDGNKVNITTVRNLIANDELDKSF